MRTGAEMPPMRLADFKVVGGFLEQGTGVSWERLVQSEMALRVRTTHHIDARVPMVGVILSSISAMTLVLAEIYRHLDGALIGQVSAAAPLRYYLVAGIAAGVAIAVVGRFVPGRPRGRPRLADHSRQ